MGVEYSAVSGYGFMFDVANDNIEDIANIAGYKTPSWGFGAYEFVEWLCTKYELNYGVAGDAYGGEEFFLIGVGIYGSDIYGLQEFTPVALEIAQGATEKIQRVLDDLELSDKKIAFYSGMHVF